MATEVRVSQVVIEVATTNVPQLWISQVAVEVAVPSVEAAPSKQTMLIGSIS
jgi:hypothetical protein